MRRLLREQDQAGALPAALARLIPAGAIRRQSGTLFVASNVIFRFCPLKIQCTRIPHRKFWQVPRIAATSSGLQRPKPASPVRCPNRPTPPKLNSALCTLNSSFKMVGRHGFAPCSRRLRAGTSLSKFATRTRRGGGVEPPQSGL